MSPYDVASNIHHALNDGNYRETRWFTAWQRPSVVESHRLPAAVAVAAGQDRVPFGDAALEFQDASLASETCEELFTPAAPHIQLVGPGGCCSPGHEMPMNSRTE